MRTDTRLLCNLSLISDSNGIALRRKNFFFERQQQHAHVLQKCTFFVDLSKGAEVRLQVCRLLRFLDSAVNGTSDFASTVVVADFCVKHICSHFSCLKIWGFLRMPRV